MTLTLEAILAKLPIGKLSETIKAHVLPLVNLLPDKRLGAVVQNMILGILGGQTPVITGMARTNSKTEGESWPVAKRIYRFLCKRKLDVDPLILPLPPDTPPEFPHIVIKNEKIRTVCRQQICAHKRSVQKNTDCRDWPITAAFYSAIHFAEAGFEGTEIQHSELKRPHNEDPHSFRERMVKEKFGNSCWRSYRKLRNASQNVRYLGLWQSKSGGMSLDYYKPVDVTNFVDRDLDIVRNEVQKHSGLNLS